MVKGGTPRLTTLQLVLIVHSWHCHPLERWP